ncbi:hypothetical protein NDU88_011022 [Pleurodeles waltl]|uniref:Uncharacterized protein n=1 Tax=Pleurodeles waltl TaxID=8319 RepID=A0AAV7R273_PLEWA|nr:hypothetical protein NDU88_011022 [Pleurodeles waltl]
MLQSRPEPSPQVALRSRRPHPAPEPRVGEAALGKRRAPTGFPWLHGLHPEPENWNEHGGLEVQGLPGVDLLAPCSNEVALRSRGPREEIEVAHRLCGLCPDPRPRVEAPCGRAGSAWRPGIGAVDRKGESGNLPACSREITPRPRGPHRRRVLRALEELGAP